MTTEAEGELDTRARRRMQKFGESYAKACERELADHPGLYTRYEAEKAAGSLFAAPEYVDTKMDIDNDIDPDDDEDAAVPDNSMYGRRAQATANNDLVDQQRKNKNKMRR